MASRVTLALLSIGAFVAGAFLFSTFNCKKSDANVEIEHAVLRAESASPRSSEIELGVLRAESANPSSPPARYEISPLVFRLGVNLALRHNEVSPFVTSKHPAYDTGNHACIRSTQT